jgi:hypothetical protein
MGDFGEIVRMGCGSARRISLRSWIVLELLAEEREVTAAHARAPPPRQPRAEIESRQRHSRVAAPAVQQEHIDLYIVARSLEIEFRL